MLLVYATSCIFVGCKNDRRHHGVVFRTMNGKSPMGTDLLHETYHILFLRCETDLANDLYGFCDVAGIAYKMPVFTATTGLKGPLADCTDHGSCGSEVLNLCPADETASAVNDCFLMGDLVRSAITGFFF